MSDHSKCTICGYEGIVDEELFVCEICGQTVCEDCECSCVTRTDFRVESFREEVSVATVGELLDALGAVARDTPLRTTLGEETTVQFEQWVTPPHCPRVRIDDF